MINLVNVREFEFGWVSHFQDMLDDLVKPELEAWANADARDDDNGYFSCDHSAQSEAAYWTLGSDTVDELCVRVATHRVVNCKSRVDLNINLMDFVTVEEAQCGNRDDDEWFVDVPAAEAAIRDAASALLGMVR